jgi:hypothetical protein
MDSNPLLQSGAYTAFGAALNLPPSRAALATLRPSSGACCTGAQVRPTESPDLRSDLVRARRRERRSPRADVSRCQSLDGSLPQQRCAIREQPYVAP